ncbi:MAG: alpha/beta hydrolase family protein [Candidatus Kariarchaeaceae archaeon]|jgi:dienelactone hydrolase
MSKEPLLQFQNTKIEEKETWEIKREEIKSRLFETIGHPPFYRDTRNVEILEEIERSNYTEQKLQYAVGEDADPISTYVYFPNNIPDPVPGILALHQFNPLGKEEVAGTKGHPDLAYGRELAQRGYVVLMPDYLPFGERQYEGKEQFDTLPFYEKYPEWSMVGKNIEDTKAALDILSALDQVDQDRIGCIGHSHGGHNTIFGMALDERIKVGVSNCGMSVFTQEDKEIRLEWSREDEYIYIPKLRKYFLDDSPVPFDIDEVAALIAPRPFLNISAYFDFAFGNQDFLAQTGVELYQVYQLLEKTDHFSYFMHGNNHSFPQYARSLAYQWLDKFLHSES